MSFAKEKRRAVNLGLRGWLVAGLLTFVSPAVFSVALSTAPETWFSISNELTSRTDISRELDALRAAGIGGLVVSSVTNTSCLASEWIDRMRFMADECHRRGLTFKLQNCPGRSTSGGPWIAPERAMRELVCFELGKNPPFDSQDDFQKIGAVTFPWDPPVDDGGVTAVILPNPQKVSHKWAYDPAFDFVLYEDEHEVFRRACPQGAWQDSVDMTFRVPRRIGVIKYGHCPELRVEVQGAHVGFRAIKAKYTNETMVLDDWETKAGWGLRAFTMSTNATPVKSCRVKTLVFGHVNARRTNRAASPVETGWECDKMSPHGFMTHFSGYLGKLLAAGVKIDGTIIDNWECGIQNWTGRMEEEFRLRNGYELRPWLPALFGYILKSEAETERFLMDWRKTCSRLIEDNYYGAVASLSHANKMAVQFETAFGDVIPGDILRYWKYADEPMCEFWYPHDEGRGFVESHDFKPVLPCVSAAHLYGKRRVSAEALSSFDMTRAENFKGWKRVIDAHLGRGITHVVLHDCVRKASIHGSNYWPKFSQLATYLAFCGRELERGLPVVDILMYLGDEVNHKPSERNLLFLNRYKYDYLNADVLMTQLDVKDGALSLPNGMHYRVLWIPEGTFLLPETKKKLMTFAAKGARIIRGDFIPEWQSPLLKRTGFDGKDVHWYQRQYGDKELFFVAAANGESRFLYFKRGKFIMAIDPMTRCEDLTLSKNLPASALRGGAKSK